MGDGITWSNVITGFQVVVVVVHSVKKRAPLSLFILSAGYDVNKNTKICSQVAVDGPSVCASCCFFFLRLFWTFLDISSSLCCFVFWLLF